MNEEMWEQIEREAKDAFYIEEKRDMNEEMWEEEAQRAEEDAFWAEVVVPAWQEEAEDSGLDEPW